MPIRKTKQVRLRIEDLQINPDNDRFIEPVNDETQAILAMFTVPNGDSDVEMLNLAKDIANDGLNPFEFPIVWYDEEIKKYIVVEGNRRITCIKLMTQFKNNDILLKENKNLKNFYNLNMYEDYDGAIDCIVYNDLDDAKEILSKIHQDINNGLGRKSWDPYAKLNNKASLGKSTRAHNIAKFVKDYKIPDEQLIIKMKTKRWISKLQRVVSFSCFKTIYHVSFSNDNTIVHEDTEDHFYLMMSHLIYDIINNKATDNFRTKADFEKYSDNLDEKFKSKIVNNEEDAEGDGKTSHSTGNTSSATSTGNNTSNETTDAETNQDDSEQCENKNREKNKENKEPSEPRHNRKVNLYPKQVLRLSKDYPEETYDGLGEKGKQLLLELECLDFQRFPYSGVALCRSLLENIICLWGSECNFKYTTSNLEAMYRFCLQKLLSLKIIDGKENSTLSRSVNNDKFIADLNTWIHGNDLLCVDIVKLYSGWRINRLLIEKFIRYKNK